MAQQRSPLVRLECPNCTRPIDQYNATSQSINCPSCGSTVALGVGDPELLVKGGRIPKSPFPINLGDRANIMNTEFIVLGRVVYRGWDDEDSWTWHEWLLGGADGRMLWLSHDESGFAIFRKMRFRSLFNPQTDFQLEVSEGQKAYMHERYPAQILGAEGELTWRAKKGDRLFVAEGAGGGAKYSVQQTPAEMEVYRGRAIAEEALARAFGNQEWLKKLKQAQNRKGTLRTVAIACIIFAVLAFGAALFVSSSGEELEPVTMQLSQDNPTGSFSIELDKENRPAIVGIRLNSGSLPENTYADLDVSITAPDEQTYFLFTQELWHETGRDEDGPWRETHYRHSEMFVPLITGPHKVQVTFDEANPVSGVDIEVTVRRNHIMPTWFVIYGVVTGVIAFIVLLMGSGKASAQS